MKIYFVFNKKDLPFSTFNENIRKSFTTPFPELIVFSLARTIWENSDSSCKFIIDDSHDYIFQWAGKSVQK